MTRGPWCGVAVRDFPRGNSHIPTPELRHPERDAAVYWCVRGQRHAVVRLSLARGYCNISELLERSARGGPSVEAPTMIQSPAGRLYKNMPNNAKPTQTPAKTHPNKRAKTTSEPASRCLGQN